MVPLGSGMMEVCWTTIDGNYPVNQVTMDPVQLQLTSGILNGMIFSVLQNTSSFVKHKTLYHKYNNLIYLSFILFTAMIKVFIAHLSLARNIPKLLEKRM